MPISWNEIRQNAIRFSREWAEERREDAEAKTFWDDFFTVFGMRRRLLATFEEPVKKINGQYGYIDLFWRGTMLAEHKSRGLSLDKAESQAFSYIQDLAREQRTADLPRYVILSDFERVALYPETGAGTPLCVRDTHIAFLMGSTDDYDPEEVPSKKAAGPTGDTTAANPKKARVDAAAQAVLDARARTGTADL
jgi:hypothetical protein